MKIQEERKASTNLLALQEQIPTTWEHGPKNWSENRSSAVQSKPDRKKATASQASEQRTGKNSPERRRQQREKQTNSEKNTLLLYKKEHHKQHTRRTATPTQRHPQPRPPPPAAKPPPPPKTTPPKHQQTNAKFWHEFWTNAIELREHGNAFCNEYENKLRSYVTNDGRQKRSK